MYGVLTEAPLVWRVTRHAILVVLTELEQHQRRLDSGVNTEKKTESMTLRDGERRRERNRRGGRRLVGEKTDPSHDLHGPSTGATWSTNIGMASRRYGNSATSAIISL